MSIFPRVLLPGLLLLTFQTLVFADGELAFLNLPGNAREMALAGTLTSSGFGSESLSSNPALLSGISENEVSLTAAQLFNGEDYSVLSWVRDFKKGGLGIEAAYLDLGTIEQTTVTSGLAGNISGSSSASDLSIKLGYGYPLMDNVSIGGSLSFLTEEIDNKRLSNAVVGAGIHYRTPIRGLSLGAAVKNIGRATRFADEPIEMPTQLNAGGALSFLENRVTLSADLVKIRNEDLSIRAGIEGNLMDNFFLRIGFDPEIDAREKISLGFGARINELGFDYAFAPGDEFDPEHYFTIRYAFLDSGRADQHQQISYYLERAKKRINRGSYRQALGDIIRVMEQDPQNKEALDLSIRLRRVIAILGR